MTAAFALTLGLIAAAEPPPAVHKYEVKSGVVTLDSVMKVGTMEIRMRHVVSFDDWGAKECKETFTDGQLSAVMFSDGKDLWALQLKKKIAQKRGAAYGRGTELRVEASELGTRRDRDSGKIRQVAPMKVAGRTADVFEVKASDGSSSFYGGWKRVMVYLKTGSTTIKAASIDENAAVPASKFQVPPGFTVTAE